MITERELRAHFGSRKQARRSYAPAPSTAVDVHRNCPQCGGHLTVVEGEAETPMLDHAAPGMVSRMVRPATFAACDRCEWIAEGRYFTGD